MKNENLKHLGISASLLLIAMTLTACASKPSPWSQQASPWSKGLEADQPQEVVEAPAEEPVAMEVAEADPMMAEMVVEEPAPMEMMPEPEPMLITGDIASVPANEFTVQVVASSSMENLMHFARQNNLSDEWTAKTSVNGKIWYVLLLGVYPDKQQAADALNSVRGRLDTSPWIRTVGSLQAVMAP